MTEHNPDHVYKMAEHGPSPHGGSYWGLWRECGRKASLKAAEQEARKGLVLLVEEDEEPTNNDKLSMLWVGIHYHAMQEFIHVRGLSADHVIWPESMAGDINYREAVRLFLGYQRIWGGVEARYGARILGVEVALGEKDPELVKSILGGYYTGRADAIIEITDPSVALRNTGLTLMPGRYILDHKTSKAKSGKDDEKFSSRNMQAASYLWLDALENGENGAVGLIFDRLFLHKDLEKVKSYGAYVAYPQLDTEDRLRSMIAIGLRNQAHPLPDPNACVGLYGDICIFKKLGTCPGY